MKIIGAENLNTAEIALKITEGYRLVSYKYCISLIVVTIQRSSPLYLLGKSDRGTAISFSYAAISMFFGWWGFPWGPIRTIQCLYSTINGGINHSSIFISSALNDVDLAQVAPPILSPKQNSSGLALASFILGLSGILLFGPLTAIPAVICGHIAISQIKRSTLCGKKLAVTGLILGYIGILLFISIIAYIIQTKKA